MKVRKIRRLFRIGLSTTSILLSMVLSMALGLTSAVANTNTSVVDARVPEMQSIRVTRLDGTEIQVGVSYPSLERFPVLLFIQGSGCASERASFAALTQEKRRNVALLYIEKSGIKDHQGTCPQNFLHHNTIDSRIMDVLRVIQVLRNDPRWNRELYVIGLSEGGLLAGLTAAFVPEVKRVAILSFGGGLTMGEWWPNLTYKARLIETGSVEQAEVERKETLRKFASARLNPSFEETFYGAANTSAWWASIIDIRLQHALLDVSVPIAIYHGELDEFAPVEGARKLEQAFRDAGKTNLHYFELAGLNHGFTDSDGKSRAFVTLNSALDWLIR